MTNPHFDFATWLMTPPSAAWALEHCHIDAAVLNMHTFKLESLDSRTQLEEYDLAGNLVTKFTVYWALVAPRRIEFKFVGSSEIFIMTPLGPT